MPGRTKKVIYFFSSADDPTLDGLQVQHRQKDGTQRMVANPAVVQPSRVGSSAEEKKYITFFVLPGIGSYLPSLHYFLLPLIFYTFGVKYCRWKVLAVGSSCPSCISLAFDQHFVKIKACKVVIQKMGTAMNLKFILESLVIMSMPSLDSQHELFST
jgi:hypothetical protein